MEKRVELLERDMRAIGDKLDAVRADTQYLKGRLEDIPTKDWMNTRLLAYLTIVVAIVGVMFRFLPGL